MAMVVPGNGSWNFKELDPVQGALDCIGQGRPERGIAQCKVKTAKGAIKNSLHMAYFGNFEPFISLISHESRWEK
jgi:hypothetical protein